MENILTFLQNLYNMCNVVVRSQPENTALDYAAYLFEASSSGLAR